MKTSEFYIIRYILERAIERNNITFTEREVADKLNISQNAVFRAIKKTQQFGGMAISKSRVVGCRILDYEKLLNYLGSIRNLSEDIVYTTYVPDVGVSKIEKMLLNFGSLSCYSGYTFLFGNDIADYPYIYSYVLPEKISSIKKIFPKKHHFDNLIILKPDIMLADSMRKKKLSTVSLIQMYIDLWQLKDWQADRFMKKILEKITEIYEGADSILYRRGNKK